MREKVRKRLYLMTLHAEEEMDNDGLTVYDVESIILTGQVIERQRDRKTGQSLGLHEESVPYGDGDDDLESWLSSLPL